MDPSRVDDDQAQAHAVKKPCEQSTGGVRAREMIAKPYAISGTSVMPFGKDKHGSFEATIETASELAAVTMKTGETLA